MGDRLTLRDAVELEVWLDERAAFLAEAGRDNLIASEATATQRAAEQWADDAVRALRERLPASDAPPDLSPPVDAGWLNKFAALADALTLPDPAAQHPSNVIGEAVRRLRLPASDARESTWLAAEAYGADRECPECQRVVRCIEARDGDLVVCATHYDPAIPRDYTAPREQLERLLAAITPDYQAAYCLDPVATVQQVDEAIRRLTVLVARGPTEGASDAGEELRNSVFAVVRDLDSLGAAPGLVSVLRAALAKFGERPPTGGAASLEDMDAVIDPSADMAENAEEMRSPAPSVPDAPGWPGSWSNIVKDAERTEAMREADPGRYAGKMDLAFGMLVLRLRAALDAARDAAAELDAIDDARHSMMTARAERNEAQVQRDALIGAVEADAARVQAWGKSLEAAEGPGLLSIAGSLLAAVDAAKGHAPVG
jgi:hypothetical protein